MGDWLCLTMLISIQWNLIWTWRTFEKLGKLLQIIYMLEFMHAQVVEKSNKMENGMDSNENSVWYASVALWNFNFM